MGTLPPESPVPLPRAMSGVLVWFAHFTSFETSSVVVASTTAAGRCEIAAVPSNE